MPRNSAGTFSLVAGNPVVDDTVIEAAWANDTLNDLAAEITDSLSRSGKGGMQVPMEFSDGTVGDPAITFSAAPTTGLYRAGTNDVRFSLAGVDLVQLAATLIRFVARVTDGASAVGLEIDTTNALANAGAKLLRVLNATVEKFYLDKDGQIGPNSYSASGLFSTLTALGATLKGNVADGATAVGVILDNVGALADAAAKLLSMRVAGVEKAYVSNVGKGFFAGLDATASGGDTGVTGTGGPTNGDGVEGVGQGFGVGVKGTGGATNGNGIWGIGTGSGAGVYAEGGLSGPGVAAFGGGQRAPLNLFPHATPSVLADGDMWVETTSNTLKVRINGVTKTVTLT